MSIARQSVYLLSALTLAMVTACGGGGDNRAASEHMTLSGDTFEITRSVTSGEGLEERIVATLRNPASQGYFIRFSFTTNGLRDVVRTADLGNQIEVILQFRTPLDLRPGVYSDVLRFETCTDDRCSRVLSHMTATATTRFTITGSGGRIAALGTTNVSHQSFVTDHFIPGVSDVGLTVGGAAVYPFVGVTTTQNAVLRAGGGMQSLTNGSIRYDLKHPAELGPGVFTDTITVMVCLDQNCVNPISPSPLTLSLQVTVTDTVGGPNGYTVRNTDVAGGPMAWDPLRQLIYLARPDIAQIDQRILVFDPAANASYTVPIAWRPGPMAISDDSSFLYAGTADTGNQIKRLRLPDLSEDASIDLGTNTEGHPYAARELAVAPREPKILAMARTIHPYGVNTAGLVIFDDTTPRNEIAGAVPDLVNGPVIDHITWGADATQIFASNDSGQAPEIYDVAVDPTGGRIVRTAAAATRGKLQLAGGLLYSDNGLIFDPSTFAPVATLVPQRDGIDGQLRRVRADAGTNRIYGIALFGNSPPIGFHFPVSLVSFDLTQRTQIASIPLDPTLNFPGGDIVRWGSDGLAVLGDRLVLINGTFVAP